MKIKKDNWIKLFDKEFSDYKGAFGDIDRDFYKYTDGTHRVLTTREKLINFISNLIEKQT